MSPESPNEAFLATIIDSVGDGVIVIDLGGRITLMNPAAEEIIAISRRQAMGHPFAALLGSQEILVDMVAKTAATGMTISDNENIVIRKAKQLTPVAVTTFPLLRQDGEPIGTILMLRDLTNIRELEDAVRHADRLSTLGTLAAGLAHEIKNPLGGIKGAAQLLEMELPPESELRDNVRVVVREVDRVNRIVEELLALSSPRKLQLTKVNLHKILGDIVTLRKRATEGKSVTFQQQFDPSIPPILADEGLLTQLFLNLIKNAVEAVDERGTIRVASRVLSDYSMTPKGERRSRMVAVDVRDDGPGIPREQLEQLFTPFFTTKAKGTGLGLAICQKIVTEHRGMLKVESDPGTGTTFTVMLPLIQ
ncbi:signal transduction histidine kinase, nitrogen specific, NtrB [Geobacter metallireducens RCH3]|uniref:histidine kinase n=1 Tax=Geobacter metallireducens (strain ATCC 53774 / DSM 7210 / GS-15) TaxID=269799 RepID=Q39SJ3_GEOMG|nr:ATP-binding protein [Geobacter metallireducens]ABB32781.1 nitrogen fixation master sensor histidine kinase, PAS domain-containing [Geobacter metallireducens GS-15]EHP86109.1 signal transduction histidine kinase, nitrogen specific, NtrB [Geobacter metallireducens RCH3]